MELPLPVLAVLHVPVLAEALPALRAAVPQVRVVLHPPVPMEGVSRRDLPGVVAQVRETLAASLADYEREHPA